MKTRQDILQEVYSGKMKSGCLDGRDFSRLCDYFPVSDWNALGMEPADGFDESTWNPIELTEENVLKSLRNDLEFAFEKALRKRGLSASLMYAVIKMWMWMLDDELQYFDNYRFYGLPLFKSVAVKYGFDNPIGNDFGDESHYDEF